MRSPGGGCPGQTVALPGISCPGGNVGHVVSLLVVFRERVCFKLMQRKQWYGRCCIILTREVLGNYLVGVLRAISAVLMCVVPFNKRVAASMVHGTGERLPLCHDRRGQDEP